MSDAPQSKQASGEPPYNGKVARIYLVAVAILSLVATGYVFYFHTPVVEAIIGQLWGMR